MGLQAIIGLLPLMSQEMQLIGDLNHFFNFDHNIFLLDSSSVEINDFINSDGNYPKTLYLLNNSEDNISASDSLTEITSKNTFMIVFLTGSTYDIDSRLNLLNRIMQIQRLDINMKIGMFFSHSTTMEVLQNIFQWCRDQLIVYTFAVIYSPDPAHLLTVFTYHPFGKFEVKNVTNKKTYNDFFPGLNNNFYQHNLRVAPYFLTTTNELFWLAAFQVMNASFTLESVDYNSPKEFFQYGIDIVPILETYQDKSLMYPMAYYTFVIIVPEAQPYSNFSAYLLTLVYDSFFGYFLGAIVAIVLSLSAFRYIEQKKTLLIQSLIDVVNLLLLNDNGCIHYQRLSRSEVFLIGPLTFVGFVVVNGMLSNLQSYVTRPVLQPQIKTLDDIYRSPLLIATSSDFWLEKTLDTVTNRSEHQGWRDKITEMERNDFFKQILAFNTTTSYVLATLDVNMLLNAQKRLGVKGFYNTEIQILNAHGIYVVNEKFIFFEKLNEIVHWIHGSGLLQQWTKDLFVGHEKNVVADYRKRTENQIEQAQVETFQFPMTIVYGWSLSAVVFFVEIIWNKFKRN